MKISIFGSGDINKIIKYSETNEEELKKLLEDLGKFLVKKNVEIVIVPSRGISYDIAKIYKDNGGKKVIGLIPKEDKQYGLNHIKEYMDIIDEEINIGNWYDLNGKIAAYGDLAICIGLSGGSICNIAMLKYHHKYLKNKTKLIIFKNTISNKKLPKELEEEIKYLHYIEKVEELNEFLE